MVPLFITMLLGIIEFTFMFNAVLAVNFASRDGSLAAAEAGDVSGADCHILQAVEAAIGPPAADSRIAEVWIYPVRAAELNTDPDDDEVEWEQIRRDRATVYQRDNGVSNSTICAAVDGASLPYNQTRDNYTESTRCNILAGCDDAIVGDTVDNVAVRVVYEHPYITPIRPSETLTISRENVMRMEPVL